MSTATPHQHPYHAGPNVAPYLEAVSSALANLLASYAATIPTTLLQIGKQALSAPGKVMAADLARISGQGDADALPLPKWPLYVILSYIAASPEESRDSWMEAVPAAVSMEVAIAATDILDELADADPSAIVQLYGPGQAMNTANLLLVVAQRNLLTRGLEPGEGRSRALLALQALLDIGLLAGVGQHLDMLYAELGLTDVDLDMSAHVTSLKASALIGGACRMGALMAGAEGDLLQALTRFGKELGGVAQVLNDIQDVLPQPTTAGDNPGASPFRKTDLPLRKRTLPIVFALRDESPQPNALQRAFSEGGTFTEEELSQAILDAGGVQFAQLVIEVHRQNALEALEQIETLRPGARRVLTPLFSIEESN